MMVSSPRMRSFAVSALVVAALAALALAASTCAGHRPICVSDAECGADDACVVGRCVPASASVVAPESVRVVLPAKSVAVVSSRGATERGARVTALGSHAIGDVIVLMRFDADVSRAMDVEGAFVVVDPEPAVPGPTSPVTVGVSRILSPWDENDATWGRTPTIGVLVASAQMQPGRRGPLRVDVTEAIAQARGAGDGLALVASASDPIGARLVTAAHATNGPRLELYLKPSAARAEALARASASAAAAASASAAARASASPSASASASARPSASASPKR